MKIVKVHVENVKKVRAVEFQPGPGVTEVRGRNGAGKSSVIDSIMYVLCGAGSHPKIPVRQGADDAEATVELTGDIVGRVRWNAKTAALTVKIGGKPITSPQAFFSELIGAGLACDPVAFERMRPGDRRDALLRMVGLDKELATLELEETKAYGNRRDAGRLAEHSKHAAEKIMVPDGTPTVAVSAGDLGDHLRAAIDAKAANDAARRGAADAVARACDASRLAELSASNAALIKKQMDAMLESLKAENDRGEKLRADATAATAAAQAATEAAAGLVDPDIAAIRAQLASVEETNKAVALAAERQRLQADADEWAAKAAALDEAVEDIRKRREALYRDTQWPLAGLGVTRDGVTFGGVPLEQCAASERLRVCVAIAMRMSPKLKLLLVRDGSLLDDESLRAVYDQVAEAGYQMLIERVGTAGIEGDAIIIEDGDLIAP